MKMNTILVLGAGRSSGALIDYLLKVASEKNWRIHIADLHIAAAESRIKGSSVAKAMYFNIEDAKLSSTIISDADVVISLLPAHLHPAVARHCLTLNKHLITASYIADEMQALHEQALQQNLLFLNECGLDPGIDHMSAMQMMAAIKASGGAMYSFESFTGGLIAPETDPENPWRYKFTWNPRNVVMAGQGTAKFLEEGAFKYVPYQQVFQRTTPVEVPWFGQYEGYANRDSLKYLRVYGLDGIDTMIRGTLRHNGFCEAWNVLVQLGCCDDQYKMEHVDTMTHHDFISAFLSGDTLTDIKTKLQAQLPGVTNDILNKLNWSGLFTDELVGLAKGSPAEILECILNKRWKLGPKDLDMVVMWHRMRYRLNGGRKELQAALVVKGTDQHTAMAQTVGLPLAIAATLLLEGKFKSRGVVIPIHKEFYEPILKTLAQEGITLIESESDINH